MKVRYNVPVNFYAVVDTETGDLGFEVTPMESGAGFDGDMFSSLPESAYEDDGTEISTLAENGEWWAARFDPEVLLWPAIRKWLHARTGIVAVKWSE